MCAHGDRCDDLQMITNDHEKYHLFAKTYILNSDANPNRGDIAVQSGLSLQVVTSKYYYIIYSFFSFLKEWIKCGPYIPHESHIYP